VSELLRSFEVATVSPTVVLLRLVMAVLLGAVVGRL
jgi:hypothetical protein